MNYFFSLLCRNRLPNCSDDLSHWSDVFSWRQIHYKHLIKAYEESPIVGVRGEGVGGSSVGGRVWVRVVLVRGVG